MTLEPSETDSLSWLDAWLEQLTAAERNLLRAHADSKDLPADVVDLIDTGPLSPMRVSDGREAAEAVHMPPSIATALGPTMEPEDTG
jgi:hypothetical protein